MQLEQIQATEQAQATQFSNAQMLADVAHGRKQTAADTLYERQVERDLTGAQRLQAAAGTKAANKVLSDRRSAKTASSVYDAKNPLISKDYAGLGDQVWFENMRADDLWGRPPAGKGTQKPTDRLGNIMFKDMITTYGKTTKTKTLGEKGKPKSTKSVGNITHKGLFPDVPEHINNAATGLWNDMVDGYVAENGAAPERDMARQMLFNSIEESYDKDDYVKKMPEHITFVNGNFYEKGFIFNDPLTKVEVAREILKDHASDKFTWVNAKNILEKLNLTDEQIVEVIGTGRDQLSTFMDPTTKNTTPSPATAQQDTVPAMDMDPETAAMMEALRKMRGEG